MRKLFPVGEVCRLRDPGEESSPGSRSRSFVALVVIVASGVLIAGLAISLFQRMASDHLEVVDIAITALVLILIVYLSLVALGMSGIYAGVMYSEVLMPGRIIIFRNFHKYDLALLGARIQIKRRRLCCLYDVDLVQEGVAVVRLRSLTMGEVKKVRAYCRQSRQSIS